MVARPGRRTVAAKRGRKRIQRPSGGSRQTARKKNAPLSRKEKQRFWQLVTCGSIFVLLVAVKLLLPDKMTQFNARLSELMGKNMDVKEVFSSVGRAFSGEESVDRTLEDVYQAVFHPGEEGELVETAAAGPDMSGKTDALSVLEPLQEFRTGAGGSDGWLREKDAAVEEAAEAPIEASAEETTAETEKSEEEPAVSTLAYVLYSDQNLPEHVSMEQAVLGFDYCTPAMGTISSDFGYREHPVEGEERFHYGVDIAADTGTEIRSFADGTVTAVGESSSYGKYLMVSHEGGYTTLYAHCSKIMARSGAEVAMGEKIAQVGETGVATGPHLHFELHRESDYLNPVYYVSPA